MGMRYQCIDIIIFFSITRLLSLRRYLKSLRILQVRMYDSVIINITVTISTISTQTGSRFAIFNNFYVLSTIILYNQ